MNACKIVMYHYVRPIENSQYPEIKGLEIKGFNRQIQYFKNKFNFIDSDQVLRCIYNDIPIPPNSILLTFDDGLKDHYLYAFPVLKKHNIQGLFFIPTKPIDDNIVLDVHKIHFILVKCDDKQKLVMDIFSLIEQYKTEYNLESPESYFEELAVPNRFDTKEVIFIKRILQRKLPQKLRVEIVRFLFEKYVTKNEKEFAKDLYLSHDEIKEMTESNMYFGSHSHSHEWLGHLSEADLESELRQNLKSFSKINENRDSWIMCYPYGNYNQMVIEKLREQGFRAGLTTEVDDAMLNQNNAFLLERYDTNDFPR